MGAPDIRRLVPVPEAVIRVDDFERRGPAPSMLGFVFLRLGLAWLGLPD